MQRETLTARPDWPAKVEALGLDFHTAANGEPYWWEEACYAFTAAVPLNLPGVSLLSRRSYEQAATSVFDYPIASRFDELGQRQRRALRAGVRRISPDRRNPTHRRDARAWHPRRIADLPAERRQRLWR